MILKRPTHQEQWGVLAANWSFSNCYQEHCIHDFGLSLKHLSPKCQPDSITFHRDRVCTERV